MAKYLIEGGTPLEGAVKVGGSKNAALAIIAASVLVPQAKLRNVPRIGDVLSMLEIFSALGGEHEWTSEHEVTLSSRHLEPQPLPSAARKLRASILFAGPLLARFGRAELPYPGGDVIGARPLDTHLRAFEKFGVRPEPNERLELFGNKLASASLVLEESSVTATENVLTLAAGLEDESELRLAAAEPHVQDLAKFLRAAGATITGVGTSTLRVKGKKTLGAVEHAIIPDELEVSALAALAAATHSRLSIEPIEPDYLDAVFLQLEKMKVRARRDGRTLAVEPPASPYRAFRIQAGLYPKLVTDHLPPFAVLATQCEGTSLIHDWLFEARQSYLRELAKMGANVMIMDPHRALVIGPTPLYGKEVASYDIRSGMAMIVAALTAKGRTVISDIEHIDRGYENLEERLRAVGAKIERLE